MPRINIPNTSISYGWYPREQGWSAGMNLNMQVMGQVARGMVISRSIAEPPEAPSEGDGYIVPVGATGDWAGEDNKQAVFLSDTWVFIEPLGMPVYVQDEDAHVCWKGSGYVFFIVTEEDAVRAEIAADEAETAEAGAETARAAAVTAQSAAETAQTGAETAETNAAASASAAAGSASDAQGYANTAATNADIYDDTAAGLAGTVEGDQFQVESADGSEFIRYLHEAGPTATEVGRFPGASAIDEIYAAQYIPKFEAVQQLRDKQQAEHESASKKAAVVILLGQSLNAAWVGAPVKAVANSNSYMFTGGAHVSDFQLWATNQGFATNWSDVASVVDFAEGTGQSPCVGVASTVVGGRYARCYTGSIAIGSRSMADLSAAGPRCNLFAFCHRFTELVRADGYEPEIMFYSAHGERDALDGLSEADYYSQGMIYYTMCQLAASQAMQARDYRAPVILSQPLQNSAGSGDNDRAISTAITRIARDLPNAADIGGVYQWPANTDRVHPTPGGYVQRGEFVGAVLRGMTERGIKWPGPYITDVALDGTDFYVTFSDEVERDTSCTAGTNLNAANALDGFEWLDNGSFIQITGLTYNGRLVSGTLASAPVGTIEQQALRIAAQTTTATFTAGAENHSGSQVRATQGGVGGIYDPTQTSYFWANKQEIGVRSL